MRITSIITARQNSTRLPNKALVDICGKPLILRTIEGVRQSQLIDKVVISTTEDSVGIIELCKKNNVSYSISPEGDILNALYKAARENKADIIVRVWGDCPIINPEIIDETIAHSLKSGYQYTYSKNHPVGQTVAVIPIQTLIHAWYTIKAAEHRRWIHKYFVEQYSDYVVGVCYSKVGNPNLNYTVDTQDDLNRIRQICSGK